MDSDAFKPRWRRKQAEWALWHYFASYKDWGGHNVLSRQPPPKVFSSRVRKLLDLDRSFDKSRLGETSATEWAFYDTPGTGTGSERPLSDFNVFLLAVALDMLNTGLKQSEILFFLRHTRDRIEQQYRDIHNRAMPAPVMQAGRHIHTSQDHPNAPALSFKGIAVADFSVFMLVQRQELRELLEGSATSGSGPTSMPLFWHPTFVYGLDALTKELYDRRNSYRCFIALELADMARALPDILADTPRFQRGRPKG